MLSFSSKVPSVLNKVHTLAKILADMRIYPDPEAEHKNIQEQHITRHCGGFSLLYASADHRSARQAQFRIAISRALNNAKALSDEFSIGTASKSSPTAEKEGIAYFVIT